MTRTECLIEAEQMMDAHRDREIERWWSEFIFDPAVDVVLRERFDAVKRKRLAEIEGWLLRGAATLQ